jgi:4-hydroxy-3-polyprenylbenzoate decarboxylase
MDLRGFIARLDQERLLHRIEHPVDWRYEIGEITRNHQVPLLFENIKDYPARAVFTNGLSCSSSITLALGLDAGSSQRSIVRDAARRIAVPIKPVIVESGPVLENVVEGDRINFLEFPVPQWSRQDGGRYLGTWHINVTRDWDTGRRNLGVYRMQVLGPNRATVSTSPRSHLGRHLAKAEREGRPLEMAVVIGAGETLMIAAGAACPEGRDEYDLAGSLQQEPVRLVKCKTVNLEVPADAEIVIEGLIHPGARVPDGPYFDYAGKPTTNRAAFVFEATRLMFRNQPIFRGAAIGHPGAEDQLLFSLLSKLNLFDFHNSRIRHWVEMNLIRAGLFRAFQFAGRITVPSVLRRKKAKEEARPRREN